MPFFTFSTLLDIFNQLGIALLTWGWLLIVIIVLWIAWEVYIFIKHIDYVSAIQWTFLQITVPDDTPQTPKAMEQAFEVWGGIHKNPDLIEKYFEGYMLAWYSCELQCTRNKVRFIMVVPTVHRKFFEGVLYGQYPAASIVEVEDYAQDFGIKDLEKTFDMYGTELIFTKEDYYPMRTYLEYEDALAEDDRYIDPLQSLIEAFTTCEEGEHYWFQMLVKPVDAKEISKWSTTGQDKILKLAGREKKSKSGILSMLTSTFISIPGELLKVAAGNVSEEKKKEKKERLFMTPAEQDESKGILQKVVRSGFKTKLRIMHIAPAGKLHKPNVSKTIGVFKQFNSIHLNSLRPDPATKTNGPNYILKTTRRNWRKRKILLEYLYRDFWGDTSGKMMTAEELATMFHFPSKYAKSPSIERSTSGLGSAPDNLPYT